MRDGRTVQVAPMTKLSRLDLVTIMLGRELTQVLNEGHKTDEAVDTRESVLKVQDLAVGRKVRDVDFEIRPGEIVGLAGLLGAGRTESVRAVFGADRPDGGRIRFAGSDKAITQPADAIRAGMGFCSEDRKLEGIIPEMSVRENLTLALMPQLARRGIVDEARSREIVDQFIKRLGIRCSGPEQRIRELSGGNQQKVLLARWLCMNPKLLILDEPTRGIDVGAKAEIHNLIRELAGQGLGVLMISSELEEIVEAASRIFVLRDGRTVAELQGEAVNEQTVMAAMAHGQEQEETAHD
jgi:ribose transport system ATP-binding protein